MSLQAAEELSAAAEAGRRRAALGGGAGGGGGGGDAGRRDALALALRICAAGKILRKTSASDAAARLVRLAGSLGSAELLATVLDRAGALAIFSGPAGGAPGPPALIVNLQGQELAEAVAAALGGLGWSAVESLGALRWAGDDGWGALRQAEPECSVWVVSSESDGTSGTQGAGPEAPGGPGTCRGLLCFAEFAALDERLLDPARAPDGGRAAAAWAKDLVPLLRAEKLWKRRGAAATLLGRAVGLGDAVLARAVLAGMAAEGASWASGSRPSGSGQQDPTGIAAAPSVAAELVQKLEIGRAHV